MLLIAGGPSDPANVRPQTNTFRAGNQTPSMLEHRQLLNGVRYAGYTSMFTCFITSTRNVLVP
jgi:hypothetical protein